MTFPSHLLQPPLAAPADLRFRLAEQDDYDALYAMTYAHKGPGKFWHHFEQLMEWQANGRTAWLIAERNNRVIGSGELVIYPHSAELANLFIIPQHRGRGVGTALIIVLSRIARHLEQTQLEIGVTQENKRAAALYRRLGFVDDRQVKLP
ncbi:MAG: GNAT family N-acetyltransferase, partial [Anaerolineales bacterium]|nr:GNAT family N-acetyltransferase [Anaerolineales bacterium]